MRDGFVERGGLWVLAQGALLLAVAGLGVVCRNESKHLILLLGGLFFLATSACCGIAGGRALGRNLTPFPKPTAKARFVERGIYGLLRHPLYTAVFCGAVGWSLIRQSWPALAVSLVLAVFFDAKARREETWLRQQFPAYADYQKRVRRFLPWVY
ncbi:MAG TPA: isoprenylcysteine carboxylmethyltransferase family protein [Verrucomicrobiae bacterium]|nr:isoprenylcysteine carboxylmethyltransferase family protein [Verrucomicrobiae bacterium]